MQTSTKKINYNIMANEAGHEIFFQSHSFIFPSGSPEALPSGKRLSSGKMIIVSGPAFAIGGLLTFQVSHKKFFWQDV